MPEDIVVGAVHEFGCGTTEERPQLGLRVLFQKTGSDWAAVCPSKGMGYAGPDSCKATGLEGDVSWNRFATGNAPAQVIHSSGWIGGDGSMSAGLLRLRASDSVKLQDGASKFGGWCGEEKTWKPSVVWRGGSIVAKQAWTNSPPAKADATRVWTELRKVVPKIPTCKFSNDGKPLGRPRTTRIGDVKIQEKLTRADVATLYRAAVGPLLREECAEYGGFTSDLWFFSMKPTEPLKAILVQKLDDVWGYSLEPVDFADFDGDGRLGALFWFSGYNEDGFVLLTDNFRKQTKFTWGYH